MAGHRESQAADQLARNLEAMAAEDPFSNPQQQQQPSSPHHNQPHIYRPIPRRYFSHSSDSPDTLPQTTPPALQNTNNGSSDFVAQLNARLLRTDNGRNGPGAESAAKDGEPTRNKSFLNMTTSTLFGIYEDVGTGTAAAGSVADTPWGTGAETPAIHSGTTGYEAQNGYENGLGSPDGGLKMKWSRRGTQDAPQSPVRSRHEPRPPRRGIMRSVAIVGKLFALFVFGAIYGIIVSHLHDTRELAAVNVGGVDHGSWTYLTGWGLAGLVLGTLLPYVDLLASGNQGAQGTKKTSSKETEPSLGEQWNEVVRSVGAFVGIAFAIRRLPWQSTLQLTLTLALVNPALWYILDRTKNGLSVSLISTSILTSFIFLSNPDVLPSPALPSTANTTHPNSNARYQEELFAGVVSYDNLATATWVGSVVFCSCICFGGIGRRLAVLDEWGWRK